MEIKIEHGTYDDLDDIAKLYDDLHDALQNNINYPGWIKGIYPTRADADAGISDHSLFVARSDKKIVASVIVNHKPENAYVNAKWQYDGDYTRVFVIHTLVVHPSFGKSGIGRKIMKFVEHLAHENDIKAIRLDVYENNIPAIKLYENCGYSYIQSVDLGFSSYGLDWFKLYEKLLSI